MKTPPCPDHPNGPCLCYALNGIPSQVNTALLPFHGEPEEDEDPPEDWKPPVDIEAYL